MEDTPRRRPSTFNDVVRDNAVRVVMLAAAGIAGYVWTTLEHLQDRMAELNTRYVELRSQTEGRNADLTRRLERVEGEIAVVTRNTNETLNRLTRLDVLLQIVVRQPLRPEAPSPDTLP